MHVLRRPSTLAAALLLALVTTLLVRSSDQMSLAELFTDAPHALGVLLHTAGTTFGSWASGLTLTGLFAMIVVMWLTMVVLAVNEQREEDDKPRYDIR